MLPEKATSIEQRAFLRGYQKLEICSGGELKMIFTRFTVHREFKAPLWQIVPDSERIKHPSVGSLVGFLIFGLLAFGMTIGAFSTRDSKALIGLAIPTAAVWVIAGVFLWKLRNESVNATIFHFRQGGQIHLWYDKPNRRTCQAFCEELSKRSREAWDNQPAEPSQQTLAGEIAALTKLKDTGVLTDAEFERTKAKLLEQTEQRKIGFHWLSFNLATAPL